MSARKAKMYPAQSERSLNLYGNGRFLASLAGEHNYIVGLLAQEDPAI